ncbi:AAA family ATPase [Actinokineospora soli]|uniref:AAA family ATPase n=1 Tax=Actinokineospora soli TaxID=1048753 RepID=A0ABW2THX9_9PSEU
MRIDTHVHLPAEAARPATQVEQITGAEVDAVFTGRDGQVARLLAVLDPAAAGAAVVVSAGMGGVGKTALARHCAAHAAQAGWFPGGVFVVDMLGYSPTPVPAEAVCSPLLRRLGLAGEQIPPEAADAHAAYHQVLAHLAAEGRRVLLVVDNVSTSAQAKPLLPTPGSGHVVVVTTRDTLALPAMSVPLDVLDEPESVDLLARALHAITPHDRRLAENPEGARELARACGVAAGAAGGRAAAGRRTPPRPHRTRRATPGGARGRRVRPRRAGCGRGPGPVLATPLRPASGAGEDAAAAVPGPGTRRVHRHRRRPHGPTPATTRVQLRGLRHAHLLRPAGPDRWSLHDLVRAHTSTHTPPSLHPTDLDAAQTRLLNHYTHTTYQADAHLAALPGQAVPPRFTGREDALRWLDAERANLIATVTHAATTGHHPHTAHLGSALGRYLEWRRHLADWVTVATHAYTSATHLTPITKPSPPTTSVTPCRRCGGSTRRSPPTNRPAPCSRRQATATARGWRGTTSASP